MNEAIQQVGVVVPHYGDPAPTRDLVASLIGQALSIVVVDDASPEPLAPIAGASVVRREVNGGFGAAVNTGMARLPTELALILNSDLEIGPTFVADLLAGAAPWQPVVASPQVTTLDGDPEWVGRHFPTIGHQVIEWLTPLARFRHLPRLHEGVGHDTRAVGDAVVPVDWVVGAAVLVPVAAFRAVGGFDERYFMNAEEVDLQRRLRGLGIPSVVLGTVSVVHRGGGSSDPARSRQWLVASRLQYARTWGGLRRLQMALVGASAVNLCANVSRRALRRPVRPVDVLREELRLIQGRGAGHAAARPPSPAGVPTDTEQDLPCER
ncbi:glycosyltransferase family 2 protein [Allobranchiibius sp. GilTou73]|uniref:glycosyltransferase family 2 protein n=1 Tax=Allobranchiibius sp. GilTou73 TaxID=2904523 RepID=UPI001F1688FC|nr:glycosyltransferase family 2 protein [Allobranchiibius sp. GilTou73]UIJ33497.1 glycosyltransferase family 2 protein [Allobranchiibius sp. GilTou73]